MLRFGLNSFEGGPGGFIDVRDSFLALACLALRRALVSFGCEFGFGSARFELAPSFAPNFHFAQVFLYIFMVVLSETTLVMLVTLRTFKLLVRHVGLYRRAANNIFKKTFK